MRTVLFEVKNNVGILTLNNPPQNRMSAEMSKDMDIALQEIMKAGARVLVIRGTGDIFSYGGDFRQWIGKEMSEIRAFLENSIAAFNMIEKLTIPIITAVNGPCWGGAFELALVSDIIYACPEATFNHPEQSIAIPTLLGGSYRFASRVGNNIAKELAFTAEPLSANRMYELGVVNKVVPKEELTDAVMTLADKLAKGSATAFASTKELLRLWQNQGIEAADEKLIELSMKCFKSPDSQYAFKVAEQALKEGKSRPVIDFRKINE